MYFQSMVRLFIYFYFFKKLILKMGNSLIFVLFLKEKFLIRINRFEKKSCSGLGLRLLIILLKMYDENCSILLFDQKKKIL